MIAESIFVLMTTVFAPKYSIYEHNTSEWNSFKSCEKARLIFNQQLGDMVKYNYYNAVAVCLPKGDIEEKEKISSELEIQD